MKPLSARVQQNVGNEAVSKNLKTFSKHLETDRRANSPAGLEIERSLYYLGRALYRYSLLEKKRRSQ